ncbi:MAG: Cell division protein FtsX [Candidatus Yanofskybacteria bacterium GW2011_GWA2_44_9]|uniref:Cell division protein FtsX n=1 Tax=Candidatus Yanofskybacteria bacterium GW2011_GWA2_44_9 TaxID=1619025 RepID=A0A0G1KF58_9BACT|nr:MAG: Cell division protein FtsX [Candidatus Yanofskybacteria bacterium GW2011_GWA2_44_9]
MVLVLVLFSALMGVNFVSSKIVDILQEKVDVTAYFKADASEEEILSVRGELENLNEVRGVSYISKDQALEEFKAKHAGDALIQESLGELDFNPLQPALNIKAENSSQYASIVGFLEANKFRSLIDKINFYENEQVISRIESISGGLQNWGLIVTVALALVAVLVTFNTIRLTIYNQRQEIEIMKLVGGSNWHIKAPFLVEGALYGVFAALITTALFYPSIYLVSPKVGQLMPGVALFSYFVSNIFQYVALIFTAGIILGATSSFVAIKRFLKI